jgi:hypothetical protein
MILSLASDKPVQITKQGHYYYIIYITHFFLHVRLKLKLNENENENEKGI